MTTSVASNTASQQQIALLLQQQAASHNSLATVLDNSGSSTGITPSEASF